MRRASYLSGLLLLLLAGRLAAAPLDEFKAAVAQAEQGLAPAVEDSEALRAYVLYPYVLAARTLSAIERAPGEATDAQVQDFLAQNAALPLARQVRRDWLGSLAARKQWTLFLAYYDEGIADPALRCARLSAWIETGGADNLHDEALQVWMSGQQQPQACVAPFKWLQDEKELTLERKEQRARLALAAGNLELAEWLTRSLPPEKLKPLQAWMRLLKQPKTELRVLAPRPELPAEWAQLRDAFAKLARNTPLEAEEMLPQLLKRPFEEAQGRELRLLLALGLAWDRLPQALTHFSQIPEEGLDERGHEWRVRAALWQGQWQQALDWLHRMPPALGASPRWAYWRARLMEMNGHPRQSAPIYYTLTQDNGYYALLSAWRLGFAEYSPRSTASADDPLIQAQLLSRAGVQRARELYLAGRIDWANQEWWAASADLAPPERVQAARLLAGWGWMVQAAGQWKQSAAPDDLTLLYPTPYTELVTSAASLGGLPPEIIYAITRQESLFLPQARSKANAYGLMQLLLPTARQVATRWQRPQPATAEDLYQPEVNLPLGAGYLREMLNRFDNRLPMAAAAYNAGPNAVARWKPPSQLDADVWIESIPFNETRDYVQKILWNAAVFHWRLNGRVPDVRPWLVSIGEPPPPPASAEPAVVLEPPPPATP